MEEREREREKEQIETARVRFRADSEAGDALYGFYYRSAQHTLFIKTARHYKQSIVRFARSTIVSRHIAANKNTVYVEFVAKRVTGGNNYLTFLSREIYR